MAAVKTSISKSGNSPGSAARGLPLRFLKLSSAPCRCGRCGVDVRGPPACRAVPPAVPPKNTSAYSNLSSLGGPLTEHRSPRRSPPRDNLLVIPKSDKLKRSIGIQSRIASSYFPCLGFLVCLSWIRGFWRYRRRRRCHHWHRHRRHRHRRRQHPDQRRGF